MAETTIITPDEMDDAILLKVPASDIRKFYFDYEGPFENLFGSGAFDTALDEVQGNATINKKRYFLIIEVTPD